MASYLEISRAHSKVNSALKKGELKQQPCEKCGTEFAVAHHDDYSKPLEVRWLCPKHHREHHKDNHIIDKWTVLNIRDVPNELIRRMKMAALNERMSLREYVISVMDRETPQKNLSPIAIQKPYSPVPALSDPAQIAGAEKALRGKLKFLQNPKSVPTELPAGSVTTGTEEQGTVGRLADVAGLDRCEHRVASVCEDCQKARRK